jgi:hypothetical protein
VRAAAILAMATVAAGGAWYASDTTGTSSGAVGQDAGTSPWLRDGAAEGVDAALARAIAATDEVPHEGTVTVVSFGEDGPRISQLQVTRHDDTVRLTRDGEDRFEVGRVDGKGFLRSSDALLRLGGVESPLAQLDRLREKYQARLGDEVEIDTGRAHVLHLLERDTGVRRENLYLDDDTGLVVRRETFGIAGDPVRLVAYTDLEVAPGEIEAPAGEGVDVRDHAHAGVDDVALDGADVPHRLPGGYELLEATAVEAATPAIHLLYGDGLYSLSLFVQEGRLASAAVAGARPLTTADGGTVWRWPGSEPRRVVWTGEGRTFTVLSDAPTDELLEVVAGLPVDPPPSILDRLHRGITRVGNWLIPGDGSDT